MTTIYIALLRGINVGGHRRIRMADLKRMFEAMGFDRVQTYIQSGNVLFAAAEDAERLRPSIEQEIATRFGFPVTVLLRTAGELTQILHDCPYSANALAEGESLYLAMLSEAPAQQGIDRLLAIASGSDECMVAGREVYLLCRQSVRLSKFAIALEQKLGVAATMRNWQTISTLADLAEAMAKGW